MLHLPDLAVGVHDPSDTFDHVGVVDEHQVTAVFLQVPQDGVLALGVAAKQERHAEDEQLVG
jgi:hypothetical protein